MQRNVEKIVVHVLLTKPIGPIVSSEFSSCLTRSKPFSDCPSHLFIYEKVPIKHIK